MDPPQPRRGWRLGQPPGPGETGRGPGASRGPPASSAAAIGPGKGNKAVAPAEPPQPGPPVFWGWGVPAPGMGGGLCPRCVPAPGEVGGGFPGSVAQLQEWGFWGSRLGGRRDSRGGRGGHRRALPSESPSCPSPGKGVSWQPGKRCPP